MAQETKRTRRVGELVQKGLSVILQEDRPLVNSLLTILDVNVSVDLAYARIYVSILGVNNNWDQEIAILNKKSVYYRKLLAQNWAICKIPQLIFVADDSHVRGAQLNRYIDTLV
jgi:ribosome-binding factor A